MSDLEAISALRWDLQPVRARIVTTRYVGPTATRGSRIEARDGLTGYVCRVAYSSGEGVLDNHRRAMAACLLQASPAPYPAVLLTVGDGPDGGLIWSLSRDHEVADASYGTGNILATE